MDLAYGMWIGIDAVSCSNNGVLVDKGAATEVFAVQPLLKRDEVRELALLCGFTTDNLTAGGEGCNHDEARDDECGDKVQITSHGDC